MDPMIEILVRSLIAVAFLLLITRLAGAKQISQLTFYDYVAGITIGSIAGELCVDRDIPIEYSLIAITVFGVITIMLSILTSKSIVFRRLFTGKPRIVIDEGHIVESNLAMAKLDVNDLLRELRSQGYFNISDIQYAVFETNGQLSVLPKKAQSPVTVEEMNLNLPENGMLTNVVIDGKVMEENLKSVNKDKNWLVDTLKSQNITNIKNVILATVDDSGNLSAYKRGHATEKDTMFQ